MTKAIAARLQQFCEQPDSTRPYLEKPFSYLDFTYATDGAIAVRVPRCDEFAEATRVSPLFPETVPKTFTRDFDGGKLAAPSFTLPPAKETECPDCNDHEPVHDCPNCTCKCETCGGSGKVQEVAYVLINGVSFNAKYVRMIIDLPSVRVGVATDKDKPMSFSFDGGVGLLMPVRHHKDDSVIGKFTVAP